MANETKQEMFALIARPNEKSLIRTTAAKVGSDWMIGGDVARATTDLGFQIFIVSKGKIYWLKGSRLIFQDNWVEQEKI